MALYNHMLQQMNKRIGETTITAIIYILFCWLHKNRRSWFCIDAVKIFLNRGKIHQHSSWLIDFQPSPNRQLDIRCFVTPLSSRHVSFECQEIHSHHGISVVLQLSWSCCSDLRHFIPTPLCKDLLLPKVQ